MTMGANQHSDLSGRMDANRGAFVKTPASAEPAGKTRRCQPACLNISRIAEATILAVAGRFSPTLLEIIDIACNQRPIETTDRIAGIVFHQNRRLIGKCLLRNHVAPAQFDAIDSHFRGGNVDDALDNERRFPASPLRDRPSTGTVFVKTTLTLQ